MCVFVFFLLCYWIIKIKKQKKQKCMFVFISGSFHDETAKE